MVVLRQNSESIEFRSLTMLQACAQAVDLTVDRHFGEGQRKYNLLHVCPPFGLDAWSVLALAQSPV
jgi:hypothetical protein